MPRTSSVSEKVWAQAIHAVTVQKMSLRRAAQLYGVHHMSLHRRVRGRYVSPAAARFAADFRLSSAEEDEVVSVLREQFEHEQHVTSDDVRYVVRTIAGQRARCDLPADFPRNHWISAFKRAHGFGDVNTSPSISFASSESSPSGSIQRRPVTPPLLPLLATVALTQVDTSDREGADAEREALALVVTEAGAALCRARTPMQSLLQTLQASASSSISDGSPGVNDELRDETSESDSEHRAMNVDDEPPLAARCPQSSAVSDETWEKAMNAVEIQGMSLRNAAKAHGVHFAALHRRVKKRALIKQTAPPLENYIPFEDEAGVVRVIRARADMGVLMTYKELVDLLNRTARKHAPSISPEFSRQLARKFQSRVEQSIRHLVRDWPLPPLDVICRLRAPLPVYDGEKLTSPPPLQPQRWGPALPIYARAASFPEPLTQPLLQAEVIASAAPTGCPSSPHESGVNL